MKYKYKNNIDYVHYINTVIQHVYTIQYRNSIISYMYFCMTSAYSYKFKVNARIAEYLMKDIEDNEQSSTKQQSSGGLPDIVTSTRGRNGTAEDENNAQATRKSRKQMAKTLQRFQTVSLKRLEVESRHAH